MSEGATYAKDMLKALVERVERLNEEKKAIGDDIKEVFAEAKANGFDTKQMRRIIRRRAQDAHEVAEEDHIFETYLVGMGMASDAPLYVAVREMATDTLAREQVIDTLQLLIPINGEIIAKVGGAAMRLWRDEKGKAHAEEYVAAKSVKVEATAGGSSRSVLEVEPTDTFSYVKSAADAAERRGKARLRGALV